MPAPEALASELRRLVAETQVERRLPSVSAAAISGGELLWAEAVGTADVETGAEATPDHQYRVASITKTFTAVAIMQLRDAGGISLEDPLDRHVPEAGHAPTLRTLLSHLSGLQREPPGRVWDTLEMPSREELLSGLGEAEQVLPPSATWHYSNLAFALLGEVVARVSGTAYERYVDERIIGPLGLARTTWRAEPPVARGYFVEPYFDGVRLEAVVEGKAVAPAAELWSTASELCRWAAFVADPDPGVLAPETMEEMRTVQSIADPEGWTRGHGLGFSLSRRGERIFAGHGGAHLGFLAFVGADPKTRTGAAVLTNSTAGVPIEEVGVRLAESVAEHAPAAPKPWQPAEPPPPELESVLGPWWSEGNEFVFRFREGKLEAQAVGAAPGRDLSRFSPEGPDRYRTTWGREKGELLEIERDGDGRAVRLYWATYPFTREPDTPK